MPYILTQRGAAMRDWSNAVNRYNAATARDWRGNAALTKEERLWGNEQGPPMGLIPVTRSQYD